MTQNLSSTDLYQNIEPRLAGLLRSLDAEHVPHSKRSLAEHLVGTCELLRTWGNDECVCRAGLFHSIYGTRVFEFPCADLASRKMIRDVIGAPAESLAYLFCVSDRDSFFTGTRTTPHVIRDAVGKTDLMVTRRQLASLLEIEAANIVEHLPRRGRETRRNMFWYRNAFAECRAFLSSVAADTITHALDTYCAHVPSHAAS